MNIIIKYILTNVKEQKSRTAVMLLSILLSTTLLFVSLSVGASYESAQQKMARGLAGSATVSVSAKDKASLIDMSEIPALTSVHAMAGILKGSALYHENGYYETVDLVAADLAGLNQINAPRLKDGRKLSDFSGNRVILPDRFTTKYEIEQGDSITLQIYGEPVTYEVADIAAYDTVFLRHTRGVTALLPLSALSALLDKGVGYSEILMEPAQGVSTEALIAELSGILPAGTYDVSAVVDETQIEADARQKSMPFFLISFFALTMSVFIIYSSYKVITLERLPVIGTFRSIGATRVMVTRILLAESLVYGSAGGILGIPVGIVVLKMMLRGLGTSLAQGIEIPVVVTPASIWFSLCVAVGVSLLSAWIPVRRASFLPVKDVVLGVAEERTVPHRVIVGSGVIMFVMSILLPRLASGKMLYIAGGFSLLGLIVSTLLVLPLLTDLLSLCLEHIYGVILGNEGRLAARNMRNNKNISQNITLMFISISALIAISVVGSFVTTYVGDVFRGAELDGFADGHMEPGFIGRVNDMEGVGKVLPLYVMKNEVQADGITLSRVEATDQLEWYNSMFAILYADEKVKETAVSSFSDTRSVLLSADCMKRMGAAVGDTVTLSDGQGEGDYTVVGTFKSRANDVEAVVPSVYAVEDFGLSSYGFLAYTAADPDAVMIQIRNLFGDASNWSRTIVEFNTDALNTVGAFLAPMHSMTYFILLLAAVGIMNNLLINYIQKRRWIAMYKSVGMSWGQHVSMTLIEGFSSGFVGAVIGMFVSYMEIQTIFIVAGPKISMTPDIDAKTFVAAGCLGIVITLIGSVVPMYKSRHMKLVEELKFE